MTGSKNWQRELAARTGVGKGPLVFQSQVVLPRASRRGSLRFTYTAIYSVWHNESAVNYDKESLETLDTKSSLVPVILPFALYLIWVKDGQTCIGNM